MMVKDLVETRELMTEETNDNVYVVYERFENVDCHCEGEIVEEIECDPEELIQVFTGKADTSLVCVKKYSVGVDFSSVEAILNDIRKNHSNYLAH
ncbi:hypothetical protein SAMN05421736_102344 [Evansella caseinilytica]|uniref:Uncharacterized protein n=1 Tax=Evansella caseinilytica TaxID=1503961 RepID=A0A1H3L3Q0_9BACI|nr:hypothetical protein [Evansella caseinilytica]SDY58876.1 hypothetical protein SAMN05421736_102344 [Evansella caseinilytica]